MTTDITALRSLYTNVRSAIEGGHRVSVSDVTMVATAPAHVVAAFEALMGLPGGAIVAAHEQEQRDAAKHTAALAALNVAARRRDDRARAADARREERRLARETAATITEW